MKKLLLLGALSLTSVALATGQASAWIWDNLCGGHGCQCTVKLTYRPYNAFDPGCNAGTVNGSLSALFGGVGPGWAPPPLPSWNNGAYGTSCINSGCCDAGCLPAEVPTSDPAPVPAAPATGGPAFTPPMPSALPATSRMYYYPTPAAPNPVPASGYYPNFNPGYYPTYPVGYYPPMPAYPMPYQYGMPGYGQNYGR